MSPFTQITLPNLKNAIKNKLTFLIDAATQDIPQDPVLVAYLNYSEVRLMSKTTLRALHQQLIDARKTIDEGAADISGIRIALQQLQESELSEVEKFYRRILLNRTGTSSEEILTQCEALQVFALLVLTDPISFLQFVLPIVSPPFAAAAIHLAKLFRNSDATEPVPTPVLFCMEMIFEQQAIIEENRKKLLHNGVELTTDQILCPYTRKTTVVSTSLSTTKKAQDFLAICIALAKLAKVDDSDIDQFLRAKPANYLRTANKTLLQYVLLPQTFSFTAQEKQFLIDLGVEEAAKQIRIAYDKCYSHLWREDNDAKANTLAVLIDYNKQDWFSPTLGLFFTGHWNRHHHQLVRQTIEDIKTGKSLCLALQELRTAATKHPNFNIEGSLIRRCEFIAHKGKIELNPVNPSEPRVEGIEPGPP
ncbi:Uncharacterised protein [Legionella lansingensis]|uniref:RavJ-like C-terminal domain-containing protein n=1 Tax=Legionella lansingensis TaxID=45067 RepID=A0A0W0VZY7_9GAMM|nr:DUF5617 domain-containing protein [Legionella lansingensis]KTD25676.1 hypothetical protein Llan_0066 [Legionella lansingensis]SNV49114.1 Uncharacterised protein [Legionella lansingensis]